MFITYGVPSYRHSLIAYWNWLSVCLWGMKAFKSASHRIAAAINIQHSTIPTQGTLAICQLYSLVSWYPALLYSVSYCCNDVARYCYNVISSYGKGKPWCFSCYGCLGQVAFASALSDCSSRAAPPFYHTHQPHQLNFKCQFSTPTPTLLDKPNNLVKKHENPLNLTRFDLFSLVFTSIFSHFFLYFFLVVQNIFYLCCFTHLIWFLFEVWCSLRVRE